MKPLVQKHLIANIETVHVCYRGMGRTEMVENAGLHFAYRMHQNDNKYMYAYIEHSF